jgi:hypothetical protein
MKIQCTSLLRLRTLYIVLLGSFTVIAYSQEAGSCAEKLKSAQTLFEKGQVKQVPSMLSECMKSGFNHEESLAAYRLFIQSYLFEDKTEMADSSMLTFLKKNPEYQVSPTDHSSFVHLFNSFRVKPLVQVVFHIGTNKPFLTFVNQVTLASIKGKSTYSSQAANLFTSLEIKYEINTKLELNLEAGYSQLAFTNIEEFMGFTETTYSETQKRFEIPVTVSYNWLSFGKFTAFGRVGQGIAYNLNSVAKPSSKATDGNNPNSYSGADIKRNDSRIKIDLFTQIGAGLKFKIPRGFVFMEIRSNFGLLNQTVRGGVSAEELDWHYDYADDDFRLNSLNISMGVSQIFFKPSKRKD